MRRRILGVLLQGSVLAPVVPKDPQIGQEILGHGAIIVLAGVLRSNERRNNISAWARWRYHLQRAAQPLFVQVVLFDIRHQVHVNGELETGSYAPRGGSVGPSKVTHGRRQLLEYIIARMSGQG